MSGERNIILVGGMPGSGKSRLCRGVVSEQYYERSIDHIPVGEIVRAIGRGALDSAFTYEVQQHLNSQTETTPLDREVMYHIISEALTRRDNSDLLLIDNYPRYVNQVEDMYELAMLDDRAIRGLILTDVSSAIAVERMQRRDARNYTATMTEFEALRRIQHYRDTYPPTANLLRERHLPIEIINTYTLKADTTEHAVQAINYMTSPGEDQSKGIL